MSLEDIASVKVDLITIEIAKMKKIKITITTLGRILWPRYTNFIFDKICEKKIDLISCNAVIIFQRYEKSIHILLLCEG